MHRRTVGLESASRHFEIFQGDTMNKKLLTLAIAGAMAAPMTAHAIKWKMSGQVNRAVLFEDDGYQSDMVNVDNSASNTRFRMKGDEDLGNGMKVGAYWELGLFSNPSSQARPDINDFNKNYPDTNKSETELAIRQANLWFSGNWGKLTLGHGSEAADGTAGSDLSGTGLAGTGAGNTDLSENLQWYMKDSDTPSSFTEVPSYQKYDGGRNDNVRYDSPKLGPVGLAVSVSNNSRWSAAATANTALGGGELSASLGYVHTGDDQWSMSASYLFSQGTSITGYYGTKNSSNDPDSFAFTLGHQWGPNAVSATYSEGQDQAADNYTNTGYGFEYVRTLKKANTKLYAGFRHSELDGPSGTSWEDHNVVTVGALVKFD
jgi:predicted porin